MKLGQGRGAWRASASPIVRLTLIAVCAGLLAACGTDGRQNIAALQPRGATVAFDSIDGLPPGQFQTLVHNLNDEAQSRRLAVISRENTSAYRVRGYLAAKVAKEGTTISWVWDVFDRDRYRALRIEGEETVKAAATGKGDPWSAADDAMLRRIALTSMEQLAAFLTSPDVAPGAVDGAPVVALSGPQDMGLQDMAWGRSPEDAGIFRIFQPRADPALSDDAGTPVTGNLAAGEVPLPPRRPGASTALSARRSGPVKLAGAPP